MHALREHLKVKNLRQIGMIWAFEVDGVQPDFANNFYLNALAHELLLRPIGHTVYFMPPYVITEDEMRLLV